MGYSWPKKAKVNSLASNSTIELIVHMDCAGCENKIKKALLNLKGVDDVDVDMNIQKVTVTGWAGQEKILKTVRRTGRKAEMWPYTPEYQHNVTVQQYYQHNPNKDDHSITSTTAFYDSVFPIVTSNYFFQNGHDFGYYYHQQTPYSTLDDDKATYSMFSDENPHACSIM